MIASWVRSLALFICRVIGKIADTMRKPVPFHLMMLAGITAALASLDQWRQAWLDAKTDWLRPGTVLAIWAAGFVIALIFRARRRLIIAPFEDFSDRKAGVEAAGFGVLVAAQLSSLTDLFREFESDRAIQSTPSRLQPLNATFETEGAVPDLQSAVSSESTFGFGFIQIPVRFVMGLLTRIVQGPRLSGQIHRDGRNRVITLQLAGRLGRRSWRIVEAPLSGEPGQEEWRSASELADEIACRVFTETAISQVHWAALQHYALGVQAYRQALAGVADSPVKLRMAEQHLIEAAAADPHFDLAYYNLGVVYTEKGVLNPKTQQAVAAAAAAAASAFERALGENRERWSTHYALATVNHARGITAFSSGGTAAGTLYLSAALDHCMQAIRYAPDAGAVAEVLSVTAFVHWWRGGRAWPDHLAARLREWSRAGQYGRRALRAAWRSLCAAEMGFGVDRSELQAVRERARARAMRMLKGLSDIELEAVRSEAPASLRQRLVHRALTSDASRLLRQARRLAPLNAQLAFALGDAYRRSGRWKRAAAELRAATRLSPESADAWAVLTLALVHLDRYQSALETMQRAFEHADTASEDTVKALAEATEIRGQFMAELSALASRVKATKYFKLRRYPAFMRFAWRVSEHRWVSLGPSIQTVVELIKDPALRTAGFEEFANYSVRAKARADLCTRVRELKAGGNEAIGELKSICETERNAGRAWELAEAAHALANVYLEQQQFAEAAEWLGETISWLEATLAREIKRRGLYALLSHALRTLKRPREAFNQAESAVARDPLSYFERNEMGWVHFDARDLDAAEEAWRKTLLMSPNNPDLHVRFGQVYQMRQFDRTDAAGRREMLETAQRHFEKALELYEPFDPRRIEVRFYLADTYGAGGRYAEAIRELRTLEGVAPFSELVRLNLADAHLARADWAEADTRFRQLAGEFDQQLLTVSADTRLPAPSGVVQLLGTATAFAHLGVASTLGNREIRLDEALAEVAKARAALAKLSDKTLASQWSAKCDYYEGWLSLKQDKVDAALGLFESALLVEVSADTNLALAEALARRIELTGGQPDPATVRRARAHYNEAERLDWTGQLARHIERTNALLIALESGGTSEKSARGAG